MGVKTGILVDKGLGLGPVLWGEVWREGPPVSGEPGAASLEFINTSLRRPQALDWFRRSWLSILNDFSLGLNVLICEKRMNILGLALRDAGGKKG